MFADIISTQISYNSKKTHSMISGGIRNKTLIWRNCPFLHIACYVLIFVPHFRTLWIHNEYEVSNHWYVSEVLPVVLTHLNFYQWHWLPFDFIRVQVVKHQNYAKSSLRDWVQNIIKRILYGVSFAVSRYKCFLWNSTIILKNLGSFTFVIIKNRIETCVCLLFYSNAFNKIWPGVCAKVNKMS